MGTLPPIGRAALVVAWGLLWLVVSSAAAWHWSATWMDAPGRRQTEIIVELPRGASLAGIATRLQTAGVIARPWLFRLGAVLSGDAGHLQAGEYAFDPRASMRVVLEQIAAGRVLQHVLTIPEGLSIIEVYQRLAAAPALAGDLPPPPPEGSILPETYLFSRGESRTALIGRMQKAQSNLLAELWRSRSDMLPLQNPAQVVILASIVEKETGIEAERPLIAGVFYNRLSLGMALQSDPTVVYARDKGLPNPQPISRNDLAIDSPYNTYKVPGLPPAPIANPGRAALQAVLHPARTDALYFAADGEGGHAFAKSLAEHNKNVARLRVRERARR